MNLDGTLLRNFSVLTLAQAISMAAGLGTMVILARALGPEAFGILGFGVALLTFFTMAASLGTDIYGSREIARDVSSLGEVTGSVVGLRVALAVLAYAVFAVLILALGRPVLDTKVHLVQGGAVFVTALTLDYIFQGLERMGVNAFRQMATAILTLVGVALFVRTPMDVLDAAIVTLAAGAAAIAIVGGHFLRTLSNVKFGWSPARWPAVLKISTPLAIGGAMYTVTFSTDTVMLGLMKTSTEVGYYSAAFRVLLIALVPSGLILAPFFPRLSAAFGTPERMGEVSSAFSRSLLFVGLPVGAGGLIFAEEITLVLFGQAFAPSIVVLQLLMISVLMVFARTIYGSPLSAWDGERPYMWISVGAAIANVFLNLILIPPFGIEGAAVGSVISHALAVLGFAAAYRSRVRTLHLAAAVKTIGFAAFAALAAWLLNVWLSGSGFQPIARLMIGGTVFAVVYLIPAVRFGWPFRVARDMNDTPTGISN